MAVVMAKAPEAFHTNFASGGYERARLIAAAVYLAALVGFCLAGVNAWWALEDRREAAGLQDNIVRVQQQSARLRDDLQTLGFAPENSTAVSELTQRVAGLNQILEQKAFSWTTVLNDLESAVPRNVSVTSIHPELKTGVVALQGVALSLQDLTQFMIALERGGRFTDVFLQQQKTTDRDWVEFSIQCTYRRIR